MRETHARARAWTAASGWWTGPSSSSPTPGRRSAREWCASPRSPAPRRPRPGTRTAAGRFSNIIVANGTPGYEQGKPYRKIGWNASDTRPLTFTECRVPEENLLGPRGAGFKQFLHILDIGRIGVAAMGVGLAQGALDEALKYAKERKAFGKPISKFQAIQAKLADMSVEIEAARPLFPRTYEKSKRSP